MAPVLVEGTKFQGRKQAVNKTSPLCRENIWDLASRHPFASGALQPAFPTALSGHPPLPELCFYDSTLGQRHEGWKSQESFPNGGNPFGHTSHTQACYSAGPQGSSVGQVGTLSLPEQPPLWPMDL